MCGITGFSGTKNLQKIKKDLKLIQHRGFDETAASYLGGVNLGMNRLAIQDLTQGYYPFRYKDLALIYNGEIYNYPEIKAKLEKKGFSFSTTCDAEIILPLFQLYKEKAFAQLEGMFAVCIVNVKTGQITLARDKAGEKPLYYYLKDEQIHFSSEVKTLLPMATPAKVDHQALADYLTHGSSNQEATLVSGIQKVPAAHFLTFSPSKGQIVQLKRYWQIQVKEGGSQRSSQNALEELDSLLEKAVTKRLIADVPIGTFLSGGIDSSLVTYFASKHVDDLHTFSVTFPDSPQDDEFDYALQVANILKTKHEVVKFTSDDARRIIKKIGKLIDEPVVDPAFMPTLLLSQRARKKVKVVLTGEGADELFAGYYRHMKYEFLSKFKTFSNLLYVPPFLVQQLPHRVQKFLDKKEPYSPQNVWTKEQLAGLVSLPITPHPQETKLMEPVLSGLQFADFSWYLQNQLLMKVDKATMIANLEARAPFLDTQLIDFAFSLERHDKIKGLHNKYLLRELFSQKISPDLAWRKKHGFSLPLSQWFRKELKDLVYDSIKNLKSYSPIFNLEYYQQIVERHMSLEEDNSNKIWSIIVLTEWLKANKISL